jgi:hypothetical protein
MERRSPIVEILPKSTGARLCLQIVIRRSDNAYINLSGHVLADTLVLPFLQYAE